MYASCAGVIEMSIDPGLLMKHSLQLAAGTASARAFSVVEF
jgi:hypothetical protein